MRTLDVDLGERSYPIHIGAGLLRQPELWRPHIRGHQALVVTSSVVAPLYLDTVMAGLEGLQAASVVLPDGEAHQTLGQLSTPMGHRLELRPHGTTTPPR